MGVIHASRVMARYARREMLSSVRVVLIDLDGVLYVEHEPVPGAHEAVERLRDGGRVSRFVTNTTSRSRPATLEKLRRLGFSLDDEELMTPAALAVRHCLDRGPRASVPADERRGQGRLRGPAERTTTSRRP